LSTTTSSSVTGTETSSSPIWASVASPDTGHALDGHFLVLDGDLYALAVGAHALADLHRAGLALAGPGAELLFAPLHPQLVVVRYV
jgi:hypothetical protein